MKRNTLNFLVDLVSGLVLLGIITTGLILRFVLPPGSGRGRVLWSGNRHEWGDVHFWLAVAAGAVLLVHVALHWQWICVTALRLVRHGKGEQAHPSGISRNLAGAALVVGLIGLFAGFVWFSRASVRVTGEDGMHRGRGEAAEMTQSGDRSEGELPFIRGSMTLGDVAAASGIPVETLRAKLNLPANVSPDERLGRLRQEYGFTIEEVRKIVAAEQQRGPQDGH